MTRPIRSPRTNGHGANGHSGNSHRDPLTAAMLSYQMAVNALAHAKRHLAHQLAGGDLRPFTPRAEVDTKQMTDAERMAYVRSFRRAETEALPATLQPPIADHPMRRRSDVATA